MLLFIFLLIFGSAIVYLAQNNMARVAVQLGPYVFTGIPLFYIIVGSLLSGLILSYIVYLINSLFTAFAMHKKNSTIRQGDHTINDLTKRIHQLELENEKLKNTSSGSGLRDSNAL